MDNNNNQVKVKGGHFFILRVQPLFRQPHSHHLSSFRWVSLLRPIWLVSSSFILSDDEPPARVAFVLSFRVILAHFWADDDDLMSGSSSVRVKHNKWQLTSGSCLASNRRWRLQASSSSSLPCIPPTVHTRTTTFCCFFMLFKTKFRSCNHFGDPCFHDDGHLWAMLKFVCFNTIFEKL